MEASRLRRRLYRRWKVDVCGGDARGLDSLGMHASRRWEWKPLNPALGASRGDVRMALTGQAHVLRFDELRERHRLCTPPSVTQLVSRTSNTYIGKRSTVVRSQLFREREYSPPCPNRSPENLQNFLLVNYHTLHSSTLHSGTLKILSRLHYNSR